ncbi:glycosyltransferase [Streptomyces bambusae]|uniref:glycosyltransferase family 2 protein n=1 Tax=Streptomyces bambusae TaxID=1550616 RepID=UPI001CFC6544|nr:glycosyltransferase [Streptomyces bambusae]MCB5167114.1 glycosyltransferase [Streptomyces bambusae]
MPRTPDVPSPAPVPEPVKAPDAAVPDVSVIIAVYNAMPYLTECLDSVVGQSLGLDRIEVIAVNDGSTDGSGAELDRFAAQHPQFRVLHQANTGGPSVPRNRALDLARGRYVYVVDSDDYLGTETLERLLAMAEEQGSDVVLGKAVGLGRSVAEKAHRHAERADLYTSEVYRSLHSAKLYRREVLERDGIRYPEDLWFGEDQLFVTAAYLAAERISVVGDYDCYYLRRREDGQNITARHRTANESIQHIERVMRMVSDRVSDPVGRRRMLGRHFRNMVGKALIPAARVYGVDPAYTSEVYQRGRALCEAYWTPDMAGELSALDLLRLYCFTQGKFDAFAELAAYDPAEQPAELFAENGRAYRRFPLFRDPRAGLPDKLYDVTEKLKARHRLNGMSWKDGRVRLTGHGYVEGLGTGRMESRLLLRERATGREHRVPATAVPAPDLAADGEKRGVDLGMAGFRADVQLAVLDGGAPIGPGLWDCFLEVVADGVVRTARLGRSQGPDLDRTARASRVVSRDEAVATELTAAPFFTGYGNLSFEVVRRFVMPTG